MSLSSNLWSATGIVHCMVGLAIPELRNPLLRVVVEGTVDQTPTMADRYEREAAVWFHVAGVLMLLQGWAWKQYVIETKREELPSWWGWSLTIMGALGAKIMPASGFWLVLAQGVRVVYNTSGDAVHTKKK